MNFTYTDFLASFGIGGAHPGSLELTKDLLRNEDINAASKILDIGCGTGQTIEYIASHYNCATTGIDRHAGMITKAQKRIAKQKSKAKLVVGEAESLPFPDQSFDYVLSESVTAFTNIPEALQEYHRVLASSGKLIMIEITKQSPLDDEQINELTSFYGFTQVWEEQEWVQQLTEAGFSNVRVTNPTINQTHSAEYALDESIDETTFHWLMQHQQLTEKYHDQTGARIYYCQK